MARAIAASIHSQTLLATLTEAESKTAELDMRIEAQRPPDLKAGTDEIREYTWKSILDLMRLLRSDSEDKV